MKAVVVKPHNATDETQLKLRLNDIVYVLEQDDSGWWGGHKEGEDCTGWFPGSCVREVPDDFEPEPAEPEPLPVVPEEVSGNRLFPSGCETGLDIPERERDDALHRDGSMVASPSRRVSAGGAPMGNESMEEKYACLQAEYKTISAIAEDRNREVQRLQGERAELEATAKAKVQKVEVEKKELSSRLEKRDAEISSLRGQLVRSQQESQERQNEIKALHAKYERQIREKEAELHDALEKGRLMRSGEASATSNASRDSDEARRRLFPSTCERAPLFSGAGGGTPSFAAHDVEPVNTGSTVQSEAHSAASSNETAPRPNAWQPPPAPAASMAATTARSGAAAGSSRPARISGGRANSLTRPAFRPLPGCTSPSAQSPGLSKCRSVGDMPATPRINDEEIPKTGSIKEKLAFFERGCTPNRSSMALDFDGRSMLSDATPSRAHPPLLGGGVKKSPTEQRWRDTTHAASTNCLLGRQAPAGRSPRQNFPPLEGMPDSKEMMVSEEQVNFNMSPMKRH